MSDQIEDSEAEKALAILRGVVREDEVAVLRKQRDRLQALVEQLEHESYLWREEERQASARANRAEDKLRKIEATFAVLKELLK